MARSTHTKQQRNTRTKESRDSALSAEDIFGTECDYFRSDDIKDMKKELEEYQFEIESFELIEYDGGEHKLLVTVDGYDKAFVINKTNGRNLAEHFGDNIKDWVGQEIVLTPQKYPTGWGVIMDPA